MTVSEFWTALETVYGSVYGRSLVGDLYIPKLGGTAEQALKQGIEPHVIWDELIRETDMGEDARWVYRRTSGTRS